MRRWLIFLGTSVLALAFGFLSMVVRAETVVDPQNSTSLVAPETPVSSSRPG
jgi:hypothetical protein